MIRVLLADDHSIVRGGLSRIVEESGDIEVVAEAADGREAIQQVHRIRPDVAVVDISMPGLDGLEVISQLRHDYPKLPILILTMHEEEQYVVRAIAAGANGYLTKRSAPEQLVKAIRKVHAGGRYLSDSAAESLAQHLATGHAQPHPPGLFIQPGDSGAPAPGSGPYGPGDRRGLPPQHQYGAYLPSAAAQETQPAEQRRTLSLRHPEPPCGALRPSRDRGSNPPKFLSQAV